MQNQLLFVIGPPRSGSTLLARMIGAHSDVHSPAEPHLLTPIARLGYFGKVEKADYDPIITEAAAREMVADLPGGEEDYLDALRAYTDRVYRGLLAPSGRNWLLDKTPAYALELDFIARLYPQARYVVLTRHPLSIWSSFAESFFDGDHQVAHQHNPLLERYVPAIGRFLREAKVPLVRVSYEQLVQDPESEIRRVCDFTGLPFEPGMINYGEQPGASGPAARGLGDPMTVAKEKRPTTKSLGKWARNLAGRPDDVALCAEILGRLTDQDLETWGFERSQIEDELRAVPEGGPRAKRPGLTRYTLERKLVVALRRNIHQNALGKLVRKVRGACDILLR